MKKGHIHIALQIPSAVKCPICSNSMVERESRRLEELVESESKMLEGSPKITKIYRCKGCGNLQSFLVERKDL